LGLGRDPDRLADAEGGGMSVGSDSFCEARCERHAHRRYRTLARCLWPRACWINGEGPWATLAHCRVLTIQLHRTRERAVEAERLIDASACGGLCHGAHEIVRLRRKGEW
jgi:hypothetical protein